MAADGAAQRVLAAAARGDDAAAILQLPQGAGLAAARLSFKRLAMLLHPDKNPCADAAAAFACCRDALRQLELQGEAERRQCSAFLVPSGWGRFTDEPLASAPAPPPPQHQHMQSPPPFPHTTWAVITGPAVGGAAAADAPPPPFSAHKGALDAGLQSTAAAKAAWGAAPAADAAIGLVMGDAGGAVGRGQAPTACYALPAQPPPMQQPPRPRQGPPRPSTLGGWERRPVSVVAGGAARLGPSPPLQPQARAGLRGPWHKSHAIEVSHQQVGTVARRSSEGSLTVRLSDSDFDIRGGGESSDEDSGLQGCEGAVSPPSGPLLCSRARQREAGPLHVPVESAWRQARWQSSFKNAVLLPLPQSRPHRASVDASASLLPIKRQHTTSGGLGVLDELLREDDTDSDGPLQELRQSADACGILGLGRADCSRRPRLAGSVKRQQLQHSGGNGELSPSRGRSGNPIPAPPFIGSAADGGGGGWGHGDERRGTFTTAADHSGGGGTPPSPVHERDKGGEDGARDGMLGGRYSRSPDADAVAMLAECDSGDGCSGGSAGLAAARVEPASGGSSGGGQGGVRPGWRRAAISQLAIQGFLHRRMQTVGEAAAAAASLELRRCAMRATGGGRYRKRRSGRARQGTLSFGPSQP